MVSSCLPRSQFISLIQPRLIPLASIISPAALTIEIDQVKPAPTFFSHEIPTLNFTSLSFAAGLSPPATFGSGLAVAQYHWNGPSSAVINVAQAVGAQGTWIYWSYSLCLGVMLLKSNSSPIPINPWPVDIRYCQQIIDIDLDSSKFISKHDLEHEEESTAFTDPYLRYRLTHHSACTQFELVSGIPWPFSCMRLPARGNHWPDRKKYRILAGQQHRWRLSLSSGVPWLVWRASLCCSQEWFQSLHKPNYPDDVAF